MLKTRNPLDFFHVCPLLVHEKMCDGNGRAVHKFVFACPGKAQALVSCISINILSFLLIWVRAPKSGWSD